MTQIFTKWCPLPESFPKEIEISNQIVSNFIAMDTIMKNSYLNLTINFPCQSLQNISQLPNMLKTQQSNSYGLTPAKRIESNNLLYYNNVDIFLTQENNLVTD